MRPWRTAGALIVLTGEIDQLRPGRSTVADGTIGDADHQTRTSDHNPWVPPPEGGVVTAKDFTDDGNTLTLEVAEKLRLLEDDRIKYVIGERRMFSSYAARGYPAWTWRPYSGPNAHTSHMHVSVQPHNYDDDRPWGLVADDEEDEMKRGDNNNDVKFVQRRLQDLGHYGGELDGVFGPVTQQAVTDYQDARGLEVTGRVSMMTAVDLQGYAHSMGAHT